MRTSNSAGVGVADPALLHLVQQCLVADLEVFRGLATVPAESIEGLLDAHALGALGGKSRYRLQVDAVLRVIRWWCLVIEGRCLVDGIDWRGWRCGSGGADTSGCAPAA